MAKFSAKSNHHCKRSPRGGRARPSSFFAPFTQAAAIVSQSNDVFEHEADAMAENIMRTPVDGHPFFRSADNPVQNKYSRSDTPGNTLQKESSIPATDANHELSSYIHSLSSNPLPTESRKFFESKFDHDFSNVRIHVDDIAAGSAEAINAYAYTIGNDIVFNQNQFAPHTHAGKKLLAHELTHVMQQRAGRVSPKLIQRTPTDYKQVTWSDFNAGGPSDPTFKDEGAEISTGFHKASPSRVVEKAKKTKTKCTKPKGFEYEVPISIAFADVSSIKAFMEPDKSWVSDKAKTNGVQYCRGEVAGCEKEIDDWAKAAKNICDAKAKECDDAFKGNPNNTFRYPIPDSKKVAVAQQRNQCSGTFLDECKDGYADAFKSQHASGVKVKKDCSTIFLPKCNKDETVKSTNLLRHEQGHFDIAKVIAAEAQQDAIDRWKKLPATVTDCGQSNALKKADQVWTEFETEISTRLQAWDNLLGQIQTLYDDKTVHGSKLSEQLLWVEKINAGLTGYKP